VDPEIQTADKLNPALLNVRGEAGVCNAIKLSQFWNEPLKLDRLGGLNWTGLSAYRRIRSWPGIAASVSNSNARWC
jgi:hypothetical protein